MDTIEFPRAKLLTKTHLEAALLERDQDIFAGSKNPDPLPERWIVINSSGGPRSSGGATWDAQIVTWYYDVDEALGESNAQLVHSLMMDAAGVGLSLPGEPADFPWVVRTRHISGPASLGDEDLPDMWRYQSVVRWTLHHK